jgi:hypothetical protein
MFKPYGKRNATSYVWANRLSDAFDSVPSVYMLVQRIKRHGRRAAQRLVTADHDLVIEAFPRSGSSYTHRAFSVANPDSAEKVATHVHRSSQVIRAVAMKVPTLILVRAPKDAITSLIALSLQQDQLVLRNDRDIETCLRETLLRYCLFHERIRNVRGMVVVRFEDATQNLGAVIARVNTVFNTSFAEFSDDPDTVDDLLGSTRVHLSPNEARDQLKAQIAASYDEPGLAALRRRAEAAYEGILERAEKIAARQESDA